MTPLLQLLSMAPIGLALVAMAMGAIRFKPEVDARRAELERVQAELSLAMRQASDDLQRSFAEINATRDELDIVSTSHFGFGLRGQGKTLKIRTYGELGHGKSYAVASSRDPEPDFGFVPATAVDGNVAEAAKSSVRKEVERPNPTVVTTLGYSDVSYRPSRKMADKQRADKMLAESRRTEREREHETYATPAEVKVAARQSDRDYCLEQLLGRGIERVTAEWTVDKAGLDLATMAENFRNPPELERAPRPISSWAAGGS